MLYVYPVTRIELQDYFSGNNNKNHRLRRIVKYELFADSCIMHGLIPPAERRRREFDDHRRRAHHPHDDFLQEYYANVQVPIT